MFTGVADVLCLIHEGVTYLGASLGGGYLYGAWGPYGGGKGRYGGYI